MWVWILSSMDLTAKIALGGIFWGILIILICLVIAGIGMGLTKLLE